MVAATIKVLHSLSIISRLTAAFFIYTFTINKYFLLLLKFFWFIRK